MKKEYAEVIVREATNFDTAEEVSIYENYSGRGMMGNKTTGITCSSFPYMLALVAAAAKTLTLKEDEADHDSSDDPAMDSEDFIFDLENLRIDNLGRNLIFY